MGSLPEETGEKAMIIFRPSSCSTGFYVISFPGHLPLCINKKDVESLKEQIETVLSEPEENE